MVLVLPPIGRKGFGMCREFVYVVPGLPESTRGRDGIGPRGLAPRIQPSHLPPRTHKSIGGKPRRWHSRAGRAAPGARGVTDVFPWCRGFSGCRLDSCGCFANRLHKGGTEAADGLVFHSDAGNTSFANEAPQRSRTAKMTVRRHAPPGGLCAEGDRLRWPFYPLSLFYPFSPFSPFSTAARRARRARPPRRRLPRPDPRP